MCQSAMSRILAVPHVYSSQESVMQSAGGWSSGTPWVLGLPVIIMVLRGDDDDYCEDGAEDNRSDAHCQTDEGKVTCLTGCYFCCHHVATGNGSTHLHGFDDCDDASGPEAADGGQDSYGQVIVRGAARFHQSNARRHLHGHLSRGHTCMGCAIRQVRLTPCSDRINWDVGRAGLQL